MVPYKYITLSLIAILFLCISKIPPMRIYLHIYKIKDCLFRNYKIKKHFAKDIQSNSTKISL